MAFQITGVSMVYSIICSGADQRKHQSSSSLAFVRGIHWPQVNSPHKGPVTGKIFPLDDFILSAGHFGKVETELHELYVDCSMSADVLEILKSCTKPSTSDMPRQPLFFRLKLSFVKSIEKWLPICVKRYSAWHQFSIMELHFYSIASIIFFYKLFVAKMRFEYSPCSSISVRRFKSTHLYYAWVRLTLSSIFQSRSITNGFRAKHNLGVRPKIFRVIRKRTDRII